MSIFEEFAMSKFIDRADREHALIKALQSSREDADRWKKCAEYIYAANKYPNDIAMGLGALDAFFKSTAWEQIYEEALAAHDKANS